MASVKDRPDNKSLQPMASVKDRPDNKSLQPMASVKDIDLTIKVCSLWSV